MRKRTSASGFTLVELVAVIGVLVLVGVMLLAAGGESRRLARLGEDVAKLRQTGAWTGSYSADNSDLYWSFSWKKGQSLSQYPDLNNADSDLQAAANQAVDILRRVAGRTDILPITSWLPHPLYGHLVLADYIEPVRMPDLTLVSAADMHRLAWARDPAGYDAGQYTPNPGTGTNLSKRWPYSGSFQVPAAFWDQSSAPNRVSPISHNSYSLPSGAVLGGASEAATAFPSSKVLLNDQAPRHFGPRMGYCTSDEARLPLLFADGSVRVRAASDSNPGWQPNQPWTTLPVTFMYQPGEWEAPTLSGFPAELMIGRFRWTRGGVAGRDFDGPEVCTGQPGCP